MTDYSKLIVTPTTPYYELHITMLHDKSISDIVKCRVEAIGWKFSMIDGDPILGDGIKMYATLHVPVKDGFNHAKYLLDDAAGRLNGVTRVKIECVVLDKVIENVQRD